MKLLRPCVAALAFAASAPAIAELDQFVKAEAAKWGKAVKASGAKVD